MGRRHFKPKQIIHMLREAEIKLAGGGAHHSGPTAYSALIFAPRHRLKQFSSCQ
jgi:hypothetical protein